MTIQSAIEEFLIEQQVRGNSSKTIRHYKQTLGVFTEFSEQARPVADISLSLCKRYYVHLTQTGVSSITAQTYIRALRTFLTWCFNEGYIAENIPARFRCPKAQKKTIDVLTDEELKRLFSCFNLRTLTGARNYAICALMVDSGLRLNEVVTLEMGNVRIDAGYVIVNGKGNKQRTVPLGLQSKRALIRYLGRVPECSVQTILFVKDTLLPIEYGTVQQLFRKLKARAGIPRLRPHLLRHSFATRYLQAGGDIYSLQQILGHTSLEMVKRYVHLLPQETISSFPKFSPLDNLARKQSRP